MKVFIIVSALLSSALAQYIDPLVGLLTPQQPNLYTIRGPIYVEPASLQPPLLSGPQPGYAVGPAVVGPPIVGPPIVGPPVMGPPLMNPPVYGQSVVSPSPYNPYAPGYPVQMLYDEQQDEVSPSVRRSASNTNVQSGIQQLGSGNMNLQGNIQQVNRRSILGDQMQSDQLNDDIYSRNAILASRQSALQDQLSRAYQNDQMGRKNTLNDQLLRSQLQNDPSLAMRQQNLLSDPMLTLRQQNALNDPLLARQNTLQDQLLRSQLLNDPYRQNGLNDPMLARQQPLNDLLVRSQLQNDQLRYRNDLELKDQMGGVQNDPRNLLGRGNQGWGQIQGGGRWGNRRRNPGFQMQGNGIQAQGSMMDVFSDFPQANAMRSQKGYQNDGMLFDDSLLMHDELSDELNDDSGSLHKPFTLSDALSTELADELTAKLS